MQPCRRLWGLNRRRGAKFGLVPKVTRMAVKAETAAGRKPLVGENLEAYFRRRATRGGVGVRLWIER